MCNSEKMFLSLDPPHTHTLLPTSPLIWEKWQHFSFTAWLVEYVNIVCEIRQTMVSWHTSWFKMTSMLFHLHLLITTVWRVSSVSFDFITLNNTISWPKRGQCCCVYSIRGFVQWCLLKHYGAAVHPGKGFKKEVGEPTFCALSFWKTNTGGAMAGLSVKRRSKLVTHSNPVWKRTSSRFGDVNNSSSNTEPLYRWPCWNDKEEDLWRIKQLEYMQQSPNTPTAAFKTLREEMLKKISLCTIKTDPQHVSHGITLFGSMSTEEAHVLFI